MSSPLAEGLAGPSSRSTSQPNPQKTALLHPAAGVSDKKIALMFHIWKALIVVAGKIFRCAEVGMLGEAEGLPQRVVAIKAVIGWRLLGRQLPACEADRMFTASEMGFLSNWAREHGHVVPDSLGAATRLVAHLGGYQAGITIRIRVTRSCGKATPGTPPPRPGIGRARNGPEPVCASADEKHAAQTLGGSKWAGPGRAAQPRDFL